MLKNLLQISELTREQIEKLILRAASFELGKKPNSPINVPMDAIAALLFYENSTRTRISFELAAHALGLKTIYLDINTSSVNKGESILDTVQTLGAMGCRYFVIRHSQAGIVRELVDVLGYQYAFINAGDGQHAHPTQGLLDMLTIYQHKKQFEHLSVGILGDSRHSRVAKSDIAALQCLGCRDIRLIGPQEWLLSEIEGVACFQEESALENLDVIITLRVQKERMQKIDTHVLEAYVQQYQLTSQRLKYARPDAIVMHPGPINRGIEIASDVAESSQSVILKQVQNGVLMRMAVWEAISAKTFVF